MTKHKSVLFFVLFLVSVVIIFFNQSGPVLLFKNYIAVTLRPFEIIFSQMGNKFMFWQNAFFSVRILKESNVKLATENLELYGKLAKLSQIEEENKLLKEKLNFYCTNLIFLLRVYFLLLSVIILLIFHIIQDFPLPT